MFVVYLTMYKGDKLPRWYIGSSSEDKILDGYNGSVCSKKYKDVYLAEQRINKHLFKTRILSFHEDRKEALAEELRVQKLHNVVKNEKYMNMSYATINGFFGMDNKGINNPNFGKKRSETEILKMKKTINNILWQNTIRKESIEKMKETRKKNKSLYEQNYKNGSSKRAKLAKETTVIYEDKIMTLQEATILKGLKTKSGKEWKETKGKLSIEKMTKIRNDKEWKETMGKLALEKINLTKLKNGTHTKPGAENPNAKKINIYDNFDNIVFKCHGNFDKVLKENNMPVKPFQVSRKLNGEKIKDTRYTKKFIGWYAKDE